jgi:GTPase SAR1 family protein
MTKQIIHVYGEVNSGKSAFVNALAGNYISHSSLQRETFNPRAYYFSNYSYSKEKLVEVVDQIKEAHDTTEDQRKKISQLKENEVGSYIWASDEANPLPSAWDFNDFVLVDFPGINDSEDAQNIFFKVIEARYTEANLIIYVTSAQNAFSSSSEVNNFIKIRDMVKKQNDEGLFIDLVVVVNKFEDESDDDLNQIFNRIPGKIGLDSSKIFKFSSHCALVSHIKQLGKSLYAPPFILREMKKILHNAKVHAISSKILETGTIDAKMIFMSDDMNDVVKFNNKLIGFIGCSESFIDERRVQTFLSYFEIWCDKMGELHLLNQTSCYYDDLVSKYKSISSILKEKDFRIIGTLVILLIDTLYEKKYNTYYTEAVCALLYVAFKENSIVRNEIEERIEYKITTLELDYLILINRLDMGFSNSNYSKVFRNPAAYTNYIIKETFNCHPVLKIDEMKQLLPQLDKNKPEFNTVISFNYSKFWMLQNILNHPSTDDIFRRILLLTAVDLVSLRLADRLGYIKYEKLSSFDPLIRDKIYYFIYDWKSAGGSIQYRLFTNEMQTQLDLVNTLKELFE